MIYTMYVIYNNVKEGIEVVVHPNMIIYILVTPMSFQTFLSSIVVKTLFNVLKICKIRIAQEYFYIIHSKSVKEVAVFLTVKV